MNQITHKIEGVKVIDLKDNPDSRGSVTEFFKEEWADGRKAAQVNVTHSVPRVQRGVHIHEVQFDYVVLVEGRMVVGLRDLRKGSPTEDETEMFEVSGDDTKVVIIPPGVAHGFYFPVKSAYINVMSEDWHAGGDQFRVLWNDPALGLDWPDKDPIVSDKDKENPSLVELGHIFKF